MPIAILSEDTSRAISSTLVLNDAVSVVKELLDNALDSRATNITIEVSANTLDVIQVKDNGAGIGVEDRQLLCKRNHTSKIRTIEDLARIGGSSLGFRGEALASIAELSEYVLFTTRVDGESVASSMGFNSKGKLISSSSASHSTGTTVRVSNFLKNIPVRRQTSLKNAQRVLNNIKELLFNYAFARPTVRFQFKVLKSQSNLKHNWSYAPCKDTTNLILIASKVVSKDIVAQCDQHSITSHDGAFTINALMIRRDCDPSKLAPCAKYIAIDGRPVATEQGIMKDLGKKYKSCLGYAVPEFSNHNKIFLYARLTCPRGFYDINIEPAKDQVLFENPSKILDLFEQLCKNAYGELEVHKSIKIPARQSVLADPDHNFDILLAKRPAPIEREKLLEHNETTTAHTQNQELAEAARVRTYDDESPGSSESMEENHDLVNSLFPAIGIGKPSSTVMVGDTAQEDEEDVMNIHVHNPFILAKLNTRVRPQDLSMTSASNEQNATSPLTSHGNSSIVPLAIQKSKTSSSQKLRMPSFMPSPSISPERGFQNPGPPNRPWSTRHGRDEESEPEVRPDSISTRTPETPKTTLLDKWTQIMPSSGSSAVASEVVNVQGMRSSASLQRRPPIQDHCDLSSPSNVTELQIPQSRRTEANHRPSSPEYTSLANRLPLARNDASTELEDIMDFEHRKRNTIQQHRAQRKTEQPRKDQRQQQADLEIEDTHPPVSSEVAADRGFIANPHHVLRFRSANDVDLDIPVQPNSASYTQNPHQNRYRKAVRDLEGRQANGTTPKSNIDDISTDRKRTGETILASQSRTITESSKMSPHDPRAYLIRHQNDTDKDTHMTKKNGPARSIKMPFEMIPPGLATHMLCASLGTDQAQCLSIMRDLQDLAADIGTFDPYIRSGNIIPALGSEMPQAATLIMWEATCWRLIQTSSESRNATNDIPSDFQTDLSAMLMKHFEEQKKEATFH